MATCLRISESVALAFHTMSVLAEASSKTMISNQEIAEQLHVSVNHLAKVHQRLVRAGILQAVRGPKGGFRLARPAVEITLMAIVEAVAGWSEPDQCLLGRPGCAKANCVLGAFSAQINRLMYEFLVGTTVADLGRQPPMIPTTLTSLPVIP